MARPKMYYAGDLLSKMGGGMIGGAAVAIHVTGTISVMPLGALILSVVSFIFGAYLMRENEE